MDVAVRRAVQEVGLPLLVVVAAATANAAAVLGMPDVGRLVPGQPADAVHLDDDLRVVRVMRHGDWGARPSSSPG